MKKIITHIFALLLFACCVFGFSSCTRRQERELANIPTVGNYIIRQGTTYNQGNTLINLKDSIRKKIKKEQKILLMDGESYRDMEYLEKDGVLYFLYRYEYGWDSEKMNSELNDFYTVSKYAFGKTSVLHPDVTIAEYFTMEAWYSGEAIFSVGMFGDYAVFKHRYDPDLRIYDTRTMQRVDFHVDGYEFFDYTRDTFAMYKMDGDAMHFRIVTGDLQEYTHTVKNGEGYKVKELYGDDLLLYTIDYSPSGHKIAAAYALDYKTGEMRTKAQAHALVEACRNGVGGYHFAYQGARYTYDVEEVNERIETGEIDENGHPMYAYNSYCTLTITDVDTQQERIYLEEELFAGAPVMAQVIDIYGKGFYCCQIFSQGEDLFVVFVNDKSFFGFSTGGTSPRIVFKYNVETKLLDYIGYGLRTYYGVSHVYEGTL